jgi:hypothetical protein
LHVIAEKLADSGFDDIETVLDPIFLKSNDPRKVKHEAIRDYFVRDLKSTLAERDVDLFLKSHPVLCQGNEVSKQDLIHVFQEPFRLALYKKIERDS